MPRLDQERQASEEPKRMAYAKKKLAEWGYEVREEGGNTLYFMLKGNEITFYPYSGWHTGKGIRDGRGIDKLLKQLPKKIPIKKDFSARDLYNNLYYSALVAILDSFYRMKTSDEDSYNKPQIQEEKVFLIELIKKTYHIHPEHKYLIEEQW